MKIEKIYNCSLISAERAGYSAYGNPAWHITARTADGDIIYGRTATNSACCYNVGNWRHCPEGGAIAYHVTRGGRTVIDYIATAPELARGVACFPG